MPHDLKNPTDESRLPFFYKPQPGAAPYDEALLDALARMRIRRGKDYAPRTRHLRPDGEALYTNRLFLESSPYLLQHAHNPVNWHPWADEAFEAAKALNRPVFLSVGYATCHWCHVMEEESFEDIEIAEFLNDNFVCVKVDREERPDIDAIYMTAVQALTGRGGWPMSVWLNADRSPFYGGTYFPARDGDRGAGIGFLTLLKNLHESFHYPDGRAENAGRQITDAIRRMMAATPGKRLPGKAVPENAAAWYRANYDAEFGGIKGAPKFPSSLPVRFLLRHYRNTGDAQFLEMAENSLERMSGGGIYDHVGGGFHRYATDEHWLVPHFEKMLYDNALLAVAYLEAWQMTGKDAYRRVFQDILAYVAREMTSSDGGFYSATDADSRAPDGRLEEGWYFTWTPKELEDVLGKDRATIIRNYYAIGQTPNFEGRHILHTPKPAAQVAAELNLTEDRLMDEVEIARELLLAERNQRPAPLRDEKILTSWNALMISALARAGLALDHRGYTQRAAIAARFIMTNLHIENRLYRSYQDGKARHNACLEDYGFLIAALMDLYEATFDIEWLKYAFGLDEELKTRYEDPADGGFFTTPTDHEPLIAREKPWQDGAVPSGNAVSALNLLRLHSFTADDAFRRRAEKTLLCFNDRLEAHPSALSEMLLAVDYYLDRPKEIILVRPDDPPETGTPLLDAFRRMFVPNRVLVSALESEIPDLAAILPPAAGKTLLNGRAAAYVCEQGACGLPVDNPKDFERALRLK